MPGPERSPELSELEMLLRSREPTAVLDAILGAIPSGAIIARAPDGQVVRISDYAAQLMGRPRTELEGHTLLARLPAYDASSQPVPADQRPLERALRGETVTGFEAWTSTPCGELIPCVFNAAPILNPDGDVIGAIDSFADLRPYKAMEQSLREALAQREEAMAQREALYRELTHRVKNHLQIMTALVALEARDPTLSTQGLGEKIKGQIQTLAAVYRGMDHADAGERIDARAFIEEIGRPYASRTVNVEAAVEPDGLTLPSELAAPLGMLVNEATCNSWKHAFGDHGGRIQVSLRRVEPGRLRLEIVDDGSGWGCVEPGHASHGLDLMRMFAKQLRCELELSNRPDGGARVIADCPDAPG
jgi:two-component sensor histidine kinase